MIPQKLDQSSQDSISKQPELFSVFTRDPQDIKRLSFAQIGVEKEMTGDVGDTSGQRARVWSLIHMGSLGFVLVRIPQRAYPRTVMANL